MPVFDFFTSVPTAERLALEIRSWGSDTGYQAMFGRLWAEQLMLDPGLISQVAGLPQDRFLERATEILQPHVPPLEMTLGLLKDAGVVKAVVHGPLPMDVPYPNDATAALVAKAPETFVGFVRVDPSRGGTQAGAEVRRGVQELGLGGVTLTPFWHGIRCTDPELAPIYEAASDLRVPVWIHCSMNWRTDRPLDLEHPRYVDELAGRYPSMSIICGHGGWPWVHDLVAVAWRHANVYIDFSAFRPRHMFKAGTGWESLSYYGSRTISDKIVFGSTWTLLGRSPKELVEEAKAGPWTHDVMKAWLHDNASRILGFSPNRR